MCPLLDESLIRPFPSPAHERVANALCARPVLDYGQGSRARPLALPARPRRSARRCPEDSTGSAYCSLQEHSMPFFWNLRGCAVDLCIASLFLVPSLRYLLLRATYWPKYLSVGNTPPSGTYLLRSMPLSLPQGNASGPPRTRSGRASAPWPKRRGRSGTQLASLAGLIFS